MSIQVSKDVCVCISCHGQFQIINADYNTMTVACDDCDDDYQVGLGHFNDDGRLYSDIISEIEMQEEDYNVEEEYPSYGEIDELMFGEIL